MNLLLKYNFHILYSLLLHYYYFSLCCSPLILRSIKVFTIDFNTCYKFSLGLSIVDELASIISLDLSTSGRVITLAIKLEQSFKLYSNLMTIQMTLVLKEYFLYFTLLQNFNFKTPTIFLALYLSLSL